MVLFSISLTLSIFLNSVRSEIRELEREELDSENAFKFKALNNENYIFEAVNLDNNIPKKLFYAKNIDANPVSNNNAQIMGQSTNLFFEQNQEDLLDPKNQLELKNYKNTNVNIAFFKPLICIIKLTISFFKKYKKKMNYIRYDANFPFFF
jgi:hypothetical protein